MSRIFPAQQRGLTLVELMIAMTLGLFLVLGVVNVYLAQRQSFRVNENLAQMQNNARVAFELMARDLREAGGNPCGTSRVANVLNGAGSVATLDLSSGGIQGFGGDEVMTGIAQFGEDEGLRFQGTDGVIVRQVIEASSNVVKIEDHSPPQSAQFKVTTKNHGFNDGDVAMACDYRQAAIFQITNAQSGTNNTIVHNDGNGNPGNCRKGLEWPTDCTVNGGYYEYRPGSILMRVSTRVVGWYIGNNSLGQCDPDNSPRACSLFRVVVTNGTVGAPQEIARGVHALVLEYLVREATKYEFAADVASWSDDAASPVIAARVRIDLVSAEDVGVDSVPLRSHVMHVVSLRYRQEITE